MTERRSGPDSPRATPAIYAGLFLVTLATLTFEILLTRIFSVTLWYHFAFVAISVAMFGMTLGALVVFLEPRRFPTASLNRHLGAGAILFACTMVLSVVLHTRLPVGAAGAQLAPLAITFIAVAAPFACSGVCVCLVLTRFSGQVGRLYAVDLVGAALGCVLVIPALKLMDAVAAVLAAAAVAAVAAFLFLRREPGILRACAPLLAGALAAVALLGSAVSSGPLFPITWAKGVAQPRPVYERWNSFSRIAVMAPGPVELPAWSLSSTYTEEIRPKNYWLLIDATAGTPLVEFDGDLGEVEYLASDLTNFGHHLLDDASVFIVGSGGGRDILTALLFDQRRVVAVELNDDIIRVMSDLFGEFTGHLDRDPRVLVVNDEARSYLARQRDAFDLIQITFVDTWAATAAGAFVLAENSLYTREAWTLFLRRLSPGGIFTISRAMLEPELYRMTSLARSALEEIGAERPEEHIAVIANNEATRPPSWGDMALLLVSRSPLDAEALARIEDTARRLRFDVLLRPGRAADENLAALASGRGLEAARARIGLNIDAPTDDSPFFFNMLPVRDWLRRGRKPAGSSMNLQAVSVLVNLLIVVLVLTGACIGLPLALSPGVAKMSEAWPDVSYFAAIGLGFMLIEISMIQRLIIFLGHPVYGLTVILFVLLVAGGIGSYLSSRVSGGSLVGAGRRRLALLILLAVIVGLALPRLMRLFEAASTPVRIAVSAGPLAALGVFMGMPFPLGLRLAAGRHRALTPWLWGINGATSVLASVAAVAIALSFGISATYWTGALCYLAALAAFAIAGKRGARSGPAAAAAG